MLYPMVSVEQIGGKSVSMEYKNTNIK